jgi:hypothetical protein
MADIRETREVEHLAGIGGYLQFATGGTGDRVEGRVEVQLWEIDRTLVSVRLPLSGGFGSVQWRRVAEDWNFRAILALDMRLARLGNDTDNRLNKQPHIDGRLEGTPQDNFLLEAVFNCGDPTFLTNPELPSIFRVAETGKGVHYKAKEVLLARVRCVDSSGGDDVVRYFATGNGSSPLQRFVGTQFAGAGAFGIARGVQGLEGN